MAVFEIELYFVTLKGGVTKLSAQNIQCLKFETGLPHFLLTRLTQYRTQGLSYSNEHLLPGDVTHVQGLVLSHTSGISKQKKKPIFKMKFYKSKSTKWARLSK